MQLKQLIWAGKRRTRQFARKPILRHLHHKIALLRYFFFFFFSMSGIARVVLHSFEWDGLHDTDLQRPLRAGKS